jgi:hypothetical protein
VNTRWDRRIWAPGTVRFSNLGNFGTLDTPQHDDRY